MPMPRPHPEILVSLVWGGGPAWGFSVSSQAILLCRWGREPTD